MASSITQLQIRHPKLLFIFYLIFFGMGRENVLEIYLGQHRHYIVGTTVNNERVHSLTMVVSVCNPCRTPCHSHIIQASFKVWSLKWVLPKATHLCMRYFLMAQGAVAYNIFKYFISQTKLIIIWTRATNKS